MSPPRRLSEIVEIDAEPAMDQTVDPTRDPFVEALDAIKGKPARRRGVWQAFFEHFLVQALSGKAPASKRGRD